MKQKQIPSFSTLPISNSGGRIPNVLSGGYFIMEIWKDIPGYEGLYQASNLGNIKSFSGKLKCTNHKFRISKERILKPGDNGKGYLFVALWKYQLRKRQYVHRLIGITFIQNPRNNPCINHINGIKSDNSVENLEWCTRRENSQHAYKLGLLPHLKNMQEKAVLQTRGSKSNFAKLRESDIPEIRQLKLSGLVNEKIGLIYGVCRETIGNIIRGNTWKHVQP